MLGREVGTRAKQRDRKGNLGGWICGRNLFRAHAIASQLSVFSKYRVATGPSEFRLFKKNSEGRIFPLPKNKKGSKFKV